MRTTLVSLLAGAALGATTPAWAAPAAPTCANVYCATLPSPEERLAFVAYAVGHDGAAPTSCDALMGADRTGCAVLRGMLADTKRGALYAKMSANWAPARRTAFARLLTTHEAYAWAIGERETDRLDANAGADAVAAEQAEKTSFTVLLKSIVAGEGRSVGQVASADPDGALNAAYAQVMAVGDPADLAWGTIDKAGIRQTERAWIAYRDAFVAFARTFGGEAADLVKAELTRHRTARLEEFLAD